MHPTSCFTPRVDRLFREDSLVTEDAIVLHTGERQLPKYVARRIARSGWQCPSPELGRYKLMQQFIVGKGI
jgi:hypothetical protein